MSAVTVEQDTTTETRYRDALKVIRKAGVKTRLNVMSCCRSCATHKHLGFQSESDLTDKPYVWTFGGHGGRVTWIGGMPYSADEVRNHNRRRGWATAPTERAREKCIYFNHGGPGVAAATVASAAFIAAGFDVEWNGTEGQCVIVNINWA